MSSPNIASRLYRWLTVDVGIVDLITAVVYAIVALTVLIMLGLWWLFPAMLAVLALGALLRLWLRRRRATPA
jgi:hypothetical protein